MQKTCVVTTATAKELSSCLPQSLKAEMPSPGEWSLLELNHRRIYLLVTGVGPINAAGALGRLLGSVDDALGVINLGVAGSFDLDVYPLGTPVVVTEEIWPEFGLVTDRGIDPRGIGFSQGRLPSGPVWDRLDLQPRRTMAVLGVSSDADWTESSSLTVAGVTGSSDLTLVRKRLGADLENMEGFALAWTAVRYGLPFLEIRTISNLVGSRSAQDWDLPAALKALATVFDRLFMPKNMNRPASPSQNA